MLPLKKCFLSEPEIIEGKLQDFVLITILQQFHKGLYTLIQI